LFFPGSFGLSRFLAGSNMSTLQQLRGTMCYCAPETFEGEYYTDKSDVYSLGIMLWEMVYRCVTGEYKRPYAEFTFISNQLQIIVQTAQCGLRPTIPNVDAVPNLLCEFIERCWDADASARPTALEAIELVGDCEKDFEVNAEAWEAAINVATVQVDVADDDAGEGEGD
jgi:serine/threonine protein kinase